MAAVINIKNPAERNKMIAAAVLGLVALIALYFAFGRSFFGGTSTTATATKSPTPKPSPTPAPGGADKFALPTADENALNMTIPVVYSPESSGAPDPGRNIFAFYEPPIPCKGADCPTPLPTPPPPIKTPPTPTPYPIALAWANPASVYAGSPAFKLQLGGDRITPEARVYYNGVEMPTTFVNSQQVIVDVPANMITQEGRVSLYIRTPDGLSSNEGSIAIAPPPKPLYAYIGMIGRKRYNNDTAVFTEAGKDKPFSARLSDVLGGRFRLIDISPAEVVFEDTSLGFKHRIPITKGTGSGTSGAPTGPKFNVNPMDPGGFPYNPNGPPPPQSIPGIPDNIPRYVPPQEQKRPVDQKEDVDDGDG